MLKINRSALRRGQRDALHIILQRLENGWPFTAIVIPTRYGKSDLMRVASIEAIEAGLTSCNVAVSPNTFLRGQLVSFAKWGEMFKRYKIGGVTAKYLEITDRPHEAIGPNSNGEAFLSLSISALHHQSDVWLDWVESEFNRTKRRPILHIDECQTGSDKNKWGEIPHKWHKAGGAVVLYTATPSRGDNDRLSGFEYETITEEPIKVWKASEGSEPNLVMVELYEGTKRSYRLKPDHETSFRQAWDENALCHLCRVPFDVELQNGEGNGSDVQLLSELENTLQCKSILGKLVRYPKAINRGCRLAVDSLRSYRKLKSDCAIIVFCGNDIDGDDEVNKEANKIQHEFAHLMPEWEVVVATSADGDGKTRIEDFASGRGDVLIVKQMASLGLDIARLKVGLDLSPVRTPPMQIQRFMRIATPYGSLLRATWIGPDDLFSRAIWKHLVEEQGGEASTTELEFVRSFEKEREDERIKLKLRMKDVVDADFEDTQNFSGQRAQIDEVNRLMMAIPELRSMMTEAQLAERLRHQEKEPQSAGENMADSIKTYRKRINELADEITNKIMVGPYDGELWGKIRKDLFTDAYRHAAVKFGVNLKQITDLDILAKIEAFLKAVQNGGGAPAWK